MSGARESERGAERLCKVNGRILGDKELVSGAGQSVRGVRETYCLKICDSEEAGKIQRRKQEKKLGNRCRLHATTT